MLLNRSNYIISTGKKRPRLDSNFNRLLHLYLEVLYIENATSFTGIAFLVAHLSVGSDS